MIVEEFNRYLEKIKNEPSPEGRRLILIELSFSLAQWMGLSATPNNRPQLLATRTRKLDEYLAPAPITNQPQLYRLTADNQNIRIRFAVVKKLKKEYIAQLVDNDPGLSSYQASSKGIVNIPGKPAYIPSEPYFIHFIITPAYDRLTLIFNKGEQKRIITFRNRLTHTQYNRIIEQWRGIAAKSKPEIDELLWKSLDIKEVNKEFYKQIKERFDALVGIATANKTQATESQIKQFSVRLIGRYIFCWFLKEKGIIPESLISKATIENTPNYYQNILLNLFFKTLNTKVQDRDTWQTSNQGIPLNTGSDRIPYLNGGLFDENDEDKLFRNLDADDWLKPFVQVLEDYDFTVDESSSNYQQVAVDPEMLGRIFENLLASQNEETEKLANQRKAFGAFYTPREIVDYMVNESLKAYLQTQWEEHIIATKTNELNIPGPKTNLFGLKNAQLSLSSQLSSETPKYELLPEDKAKIEKALTALFATQPTTDGLKKEDKNLLLSFLSQVKILDPACGSGAFPMGVLQKLVELHEVLGTVKSSYELKKDILSQNIYGVDIMPMAIEIARLRAWLSLVLEEDYKPADAKHNYGLKPLPNLDFKFVCANSLIDLGLDAFIEESKGTLHAQFTQKLISRLKELEDMRKHFFIPDAEHEQKEDIKKQYIIKRDAVVVGIEAYDDKKLKEIGAKIKYWDPFDDSKNATFFSPTWMFGIDKGFDVVIGNPPYVQLQNDNGKLAKLYTNEKFETFARTGDVYALFYEKGFQLVNKKGILTFITSNKWMRTAYGESLRNYFITKTNPLWLIDFGGYQVFDATVDTNILIAEKAPCQNSVKTCVLSKDFSIDNMSNYFRQHYSTNSFTKGSWVVLGDVAQRIKQKVEAVGVPLKDWDINIYRGILTGYNEAFIIDSATRDKIIKASPNSVDIIRPILRGRDIQKYIADWQGLYLIVSHTGYKNSCGKIIDPININNYPAVKEHLDQYWEEINKRQDKGISPYNLRSCMYMEDLEKPKIIYPEITKFINFTYDKIDHFFVNNKCFLVTGKHLEFLTCFLNSKLFRYCYLDNFPELMGGTRELRKIFLQEIPIKQISSDESNVFKELLEKIIAMKKERKNSDFLEEVSDKMIFDLYSLSNDETSTIEAHHKIWEVS